MYNNEILMVVKDSLALDDKQIFECLQHGNNELEEVDVPRLFVSKRARQEHIICENEMFEAFLNGLITIKRGEPDVEPGQQRKQPIGINSIKDINNFVLKKMKIALNLSNKDTIAMFSAVDIPISNGQLTAFLRKEGHKNYRKFSDDYLMGFLKGVKIIGSGVKI